MLRSILLVLAIAAWVVGCSSSNSRDDQAQVHHQPQTAADHDHATHDSNALVPGVGAIASAELVAAQLESYSAKLCPVSGEPLGVMGEPVNVQHQGKLVRLCCDSCLEAFEKAPAEFTAQVYGAD